MLTSISFIFENFYSIMMASIPATGIISGYIASLLATRKMDLFGMLRKATIFLLVIMISLIIVAASGLYQLGWYTYLFHL